MKNIRYSLVLVLLYTAACAEKVDSASIRTSGIYANISSSTEANGDTTVQTTLRVGGSDSLTYVNLEAGDTLVAVASDEEKILSKTTVFDFVSYSTSFPGLEEGSAITVRFDREVETSAPNTVVTVPKAFTITSPNNEQTLSRTSDDLVLQWQSTDAEQMTVEVTGDCVKHYRQELGTDSGSHTIAAGNLVLPNDENNPSANANCTATVQLSRAKLGSLDSAYGEGGEAIAYQVRSLDILSEP